MLQEHSHGDDDNNDNDGGDGEAEEAEQHAGNTNDSTNRSNTGCAHKVTFIWLQPLPAPANSVIMLLTLSIDALPCICRWLRLQSCSQVHHQTYAMRLQQRHVELQALPSWHNANQQKSNCSRSSTDASTLTTP